MLRVDGPIVAGAGRGRRYAASQPMKAQLRSRPVVQNRKSPAEWRGLMGGWPGLLQGASEGVMSRTPGRMASYCPDEPRFRGKLVAGAGIEPAASRE